MGVLFFLFLLISSGSVTPVALDLDVGINLPDFSDLIFQDDDVKMYFRSRDNRNNVTPLYVNNISALVNDLGYFSNKDTVFIIHGWQNDYTSPICTKVSEAILNVKDVNVFLVDWSNISHKLYTISTSEAHNIATIISKMISCLILNNNLDLNRTSLVGHSLGAHIGGFTGAGHGGKMNNIVGLDPALPLFNLAGPNDRLDPTDAKFVQVIHTCAGLLGFDRSIGHVDYWPNGGSLQPGCEYDITGACSHARSYDYYAESVVFSGFVSKNCTSYNDYECGICNSEATSLMGEYYPETQAKGNYYLETNKESPYAKN